MQPKDTALFAMRLMSEAELASFVRGTPGERTHLASEAIDRYTAMLKSSLDDPSWVAAARQASLAVVLQLSAPVSGQRAA